MEIGLFLFFLFLFTIFEFNFDLKFGEPPTATKEPTKTPEMFKDEKLVTLLYIGLLERDNYQKFKTTQNVDPSIASAIIFCFGIKIF